MEFLLLHGWGVSPRKMDQRWGIGSYFAERGWSVAMPSRDRCWPQWRERDVEWVVDILNRISRRDQIILGGFSDGARVALLASTRCYPPLAGLVFHSGVYWERDCDVLPCRTLVITGERDWTTRVPLIGTNAMEFRNDYRHDTDMTHFQHGGGHEWGEGTNEAVFCSFV